MGMTLVNETNFETPRATDCAASVITRSAAAPGAVSQTMENQMKQVNESTATCNEFNARNRDAIEAGLMDGIQPDAAVLRQEAAEVAQAKRKSEREAAHAGILKQLGSTDGKTVGGVSVWIEELAGRWSGIPTTWKMLIGSRYGSEKKWLVLGEGGKLVMTDKQRAKAVAKIADEEVRLQARRSRDAGQAAATARYKAFYATAEGIALLKRMTDSGYVSEYNSDVAVGTDGLLRYKWEAFTVQQWTAICDLRDANRAALQALKTRFHGVNKAEAEEARPADMGNQGANEYANTRP